jgi:N-acetylneuraminic acid mutarotase
MNRQNLFSLFAFLIVFTFVGSCEEFRVFPDPCEENTLTGKGIGRWEPISTKGAPSWGIGYTAIWTGKEMIVWGGGKNTGGRYDPETDTWKPISTTNAPKGGGGLTAVWTGREMIVWGGWGNFTTGGRYDPETDTWKPISTTNAPQGRSEFTAVWTGKEMIIWGGVYYDGSLREHYLNTGGRYNPSTDTWVSTLTNAPVASDDFETGDLTHLPWVTGGDTNWYVQKSDSGNYAAICTTISAYQMTYLEITLTFNEPGKIYFYVEVSCDCRDDYLRFKIDGVEMGRWWNTLSGEVVSYPYTSGTHTFRWEYHNYCSVVIDGVKEDRALIDDIRWIPSIPVPSPRSGHTAVWTGKEMIIWGGYCYDGLGYPMSSCEDLYYLNTGGRYDPETDTWKPISTTNAPEGRNGHTAIWTGKEMIVWGGWGDSNTGGRYDPETDTWKPISTINTPQGRSGHTAVWTGKEMIIWGGEFWQPFIDGVFCYLNTGGRYDPATDTWKLTSTKGAPSKRYGHVGIWTGKEMIVWGGYDGNNYLNTGARYKP